MEGATEAGISLARQVRCLFLPRMVFAEKVPDGMRQETRLRMRRRRTESGQGDAAVVAKAIAHRRETHNSPRTLHSNDVLARELYLIGCQDKTAAPSTVSDSSAQHSQ